MENSIFVPLHAVPSGVSEIINLIASGFSDVGRFVPNIYSAKSSDADENWKDNFVFVGDVGSGERCWVSFFETTPDVTGNKEWTWLAGIKSKGSWDFAGVVAYALCSYADSNFLIIDPGGLIISNKLIRLRQWDTTIQSKDGSYLTLLKGSVRWLGKDLSQDIRFSNSKIKIQ